MSLRTPGRRRRLPVALIAVIIPAAVAPALTGCHNTGSAVSERSAARSPANVDGSAAPRTGAPTSPAPQSAPAGGSSPAVTPTAAVPPTPTQAPAAPSPTTPPFAASTTGVTAAELGASWHPGCPVGPDHLRQITMTYWGFDGAPHTGRIVVNADVVPAVVRAFKTLYDERFPIRRMEPVSDFGGSDDASMAADNTSGFNCRNAVASGPPRWSAHAYGKAVDVNTVENPYLDGANVLPPQGASYVKRSPYRPGMAIAGGQLVKAFAAVAWSWGGRWTNSPDYQHFSSTGG